jgi:hypothetical protein
LRQNYIERHETLPGLVAPFLEKTPIMGILESLEILGGKNGASKIDLTESLHQRGAGCREDRRAKASQIQD